MEHPYIFFAKLESIQKSDRCNAITVFTTLYPLKKFQEEALKQEAINRNVVMFIYSFYPE